VLGLGKGVVGREGKGWVEEEGKGKEETDELTGGFDLGFG